MLNTSVALRSFFFTSFLSIIQKGSAGCYFPLEFQGEFLSQSMTSREIAYTSISILFDSIPTWGNCHRRLGSHVILTSSSGRNPEVQDCFKCISIVPRSPNVLQLHTNGLEKCHATEEAAKASCPSRQEIRERKSNEMMLYKTRGFYGGSAITRTYCPLNGRFKFTYSINDGTEDDLECHEPVSEAGDCPSGYKFDLHFRGCSFPNFDMSFQCLASWAGENGETYMSLLDTKLPQLGEEARPRYRCALFKEDPDTGLTHVALSSDSTCINHLYSSQDGYETLHLEKLEPTPPTTTSSADIVPEVPAEATCTFPDWLQGKWEDLTISGGDFTYRDESNFVTYRGKCLEAVDQDDNGSGGLRYLLHLQTDCGAPSFNCALFHRRDSNVMEFQLGISSSNKGGNDLSSQLCSSENFTPSQWLTLGRTKIEDPPRCPLVGEFTGVLPDAEGLCARSYADCNNPEVMFYTVFNCHNASEVYEEREYLCYGQWQEEETGLVYTYTERRDIPGKECFVGVTLDDDHNIVTEAGANCERGHQPQKYGMTLKRVGTCSSTVVDDVTTTKQPRVVSQQPATERPVSPRLSTVQSVVIDGRVSPPGSSSISVEQIVEELEEEAEEEDVYEREFEDRNNKHRNNSKKHHKHHRPPASRPASADYSDILTNEIPGSSGSRQARTQVVPVFVVCVLSILWQRQFLVQQPNLSKFTQ